MRPLHLYKISNSINDKLYFGVTFTPRRRWQHHQYESSNCTKLRRAMKKYGKENFKFEVICIGSEEYILNLEAKVILAYDSIKSGYNTIPGGNREGVSLEQDTRDKISASLNKYYEEHESANRGRSVYARADDTPVFVTGFWFPNLRTAVRITGIPKGTLEKRLKRGVAGDVQIKPEIRQRSDDVAIYVDGFWFPAKRFAKRAFSANVKYVRGEWVRCAKRGSDLEALRKSEQMKGKNAGESNGMYGRTGSIRSQKVCIESVIYESISAAVAATGYTKSQIEKRLKKNVEGFSYA